MLSVPQIINNMIVKMYEEIVFYENSVIKIRRLTVKSGGDAEVMIIKVVVWEMT